MSVPLPLRFLISIEVTLALIGNAVAISRGGFREGNEALPAIAGELERHHVGLSEESLVKALKSVDPEVRWLAAQELAEDKATNTIPAIADALAAETIPTVRVNIAYALAQLGSNEGISALNNTCYSKSVEPYLKIRSAEYMVDLRKDQCFAAVLEILESDSNSRPAALFLLPRFSSFAESNLQKIDGLILKSLADDDPSVRLAASYALCKLGGSSAIFELERAIADEQNADVRLQMEADLKSFRQRRH